MLRHYLRTVLRHLRRQRLFAAINTGGLAIGIAVCLLVFLFVRDELRHDAFHRAADRIYRVNSALGGPDRRHLVAVTAEPLGPALEADFPEVEAAVRFWRHEDVAGSGARTFTERITFADPAVFDVFTFPLLRGDPTTALRRPDGLVLSEALARKYFGEADALGEVLPVKLGERFHAFTVTGVAAAPPGPSSLSFDLLLPFERAAEVRSPAAAESWTSSSVHTYVLLAEAARPGAVAARLPGFLARHAGPEVTSIAYRLQPLRSIHLDPSVGAGMTPPSNPAYSYILGAIALLVLVVAAINFTTLSIAGAARRAAEVGVRKVVGASRRQLMRQFWGEALLLSGLALLVGLALAELFLPVFNDLSGKALRLDLAGEGLAGSGLTLAVVAGVTLLAGLLAGGYPALVLSALRPAEVLKGQVRLLRAGTFTRGLVVFQFALSVFLITSALLMRQQLDLLRTRDLGLDAEQVVVLPTHTDEGEQLLGRMRQLLEGQPAVAGLSGASAVPFSERHAMMYAGTDEDYFFPVTYRVDPAFVQTLGIDLAEGRFFEAGRATDTARTIVVNEALVRRMGWAEGAGQVLLLNGEPHAVIGVAKDFHFRSLHHEVEPLVLHARPGWSLDYLFIRLRAGDLPAALALLRTAWRQAAPAFPFDYAFLDDAFDARYRSEERWGRIVGYAAGFAVLIACLGFLGLTARTAAGRTKEIGIRKVCGASTGAILRLLLRDVVRLVAVAVVVAAPVVYLVMRGWLSDFPYRIALGAGPFVGTGLLVFALAAGTAAVYAFRAARTAPVESLRHE